MIFTACNKVCERYVFTCVCHSVHRGVCPIACWDTPPLGPEAGTPWEQTPPSTVHAGRYGQQAGGTHHTGMQSCFRLNLGGLQTQFS